MRMRYFSSSRVASNSMISILNYTSRSLTRLGRILAALQWPLLPNKHQAFLALFLRRRPLLRPRPLNCRNLIFGAGGILGLLWGDKDEEDIVPAYIKHQLLKAQRALRNGDYKEAEVFYHRALKRLVTSPYAQSQAYIEARAVVLDKLANVYLEQGILDKAEAAFKDAMKFMLAAGMEQESEPMVEISLKLSKIYTNQKKYDLAHAGFDWCVTTAEKICVQTSRDENSVALSGMCYHNKGQYHMSQAQWDMAVHCLEEALNLSKEVFDQNHLQVAVLHNDLATALDGSGLYSEAESHAHTSLKLMSDSHTAVNLEYRVRVYYNLGMIFIHQGKLMEAKGVLTKALDGAIHINDKPLQKHIEFIIKEKL